MHYPRGCFRARARRHDFSHGSSARLASESASGADIEMFTQKSRKAYQDFLNLWKDADADAPPLLAARAELAALR
jgi:hypothetical protein